MFVKITFRFKECMQRLSFRANHSNISIPLFVNFVVRIKQFFLVLSRPEASSFGIDLAKIISNDRKRNRNRGHSCRGCISKTRPLRRKLFRGSWGMPPGPWSMTFQPRLLSFSRKGFSTLTYSDMAIPLFQ